MTKDTPVNHGELQQWGSWIFKAVIMGISAFCVSYLSDISKHLSSLDIETVQMRTEVKAAAGFQNTINSNILRDLDKISSRLDYVEKNCCNSHRR